MEKVETCNDSKSSDDKIQKMANDDVVAVNSFYEKLGKLNEASGLSLVFNLRETKLDLRLFYEEVSKRGGFYAVTKIGKWGEIASSSTFRNSVTFSASQLQRTYETILLQYELMYCRKTPQETYTWSDQSCRQGNNNSAMHASPTMLEPNCSMSKRKRRDVSSLAADYGPKMVHLSSIMSSTQPNLEVFVTHDASRKPRTGYQIFMQSETDRLKIIHGESLNAKTLRKMATDAWRSLSEIDKLLYIEASKLEKKRYGKELKMARTPTPRMMNFSTCPETNQDDVYRVTFDADRSGNICSPDESMVELVIESMKDYECKDPK